MAIGMITAAMQFSQSKGPARAVLVALAYHADVTGLAWPSVNTLAAEMGLARRTVFNALQHLEQIGEIKRTGLVHRCTSYTITLPAKGAGDAPSRVQEMHDAGDAPVHVVHHDGAGDAHDPVHVVHPNLQGTVIEPSLDKTPPTPSSELALSAMPDVVERAVAEWNAMADDLSLAKVQRLTKPRRREALAALRDLGGLDGWLDALALVRGSPLLRGDKGGWAATFDWMLKPKNLTKVMENTYVDRKPANSRRAQDELNGVLFDGLEGTTRAAVSAIFGEDDGSLLTTTPRPRR